MNRVTFLLGQFSLTPALSRWERGNRRPMVGDDNGGFEFGHKLPSDE
jgi:hypothetical protein